jgi:ankyrin repeat protein
MLQYLVELGIDINALDDAIPSPQNIGRHHGTPLSYTVMLGRVEETKWLLAKGADPDKKSSYGFSARDEAKSFPPSHELAVLLLTA